jgi:hypothetical protein
MQEPVEQERDGGRRRPIDGSDRSGLGLGRRTPRRGALRARTPAQNRRAAAHATRSGARGAQKLPTAPSGRKPGTQAARRSQALAPPSRSDRAARTSAAVNRSGPAAEARDQPPGESARGQVWRGPVALASNGSWTPFDWGPKGRWFKSSRPDSTEPPLSGGSVVRRGHAPQRTLMRGITRAAGRAKHALPEPRGGARGGGVRPPSAGPTMTTVSVLGPLRVCAEHAREVGDGCVAAAERGQSEAMLDRCQDRGGVVLGVVDRTLATDER